MPGPLSLGADILHRRSCSGGHGCPLVVQHLRIQVLCWPIPRLASLVSERDIWRESSLLGSAPATASLEVGILGSHLLTTKSHRSHPVSIQRKLPIQGVLTPQHHSKEVLQFHQWILFYQNQRCVQFSLLDMKGVPSLLLRVPHSFSPRCGFLPHDWRGR